MCFKRQACFHDVTISLIDDKIDRINVGGASKKKKHFDSTSHIIPKVNRFKIEVPRKIMWNNGQIF